jgi:hypothetical protein
MTEPAANPGSQKREDLEYWITKYLDNKEKGLLDEEKANPKKKEEVEYWMVRFLERKRLGLIDSLYEHITNLNSGKTDLFAYNKESADIQADITDIDVKLALLREHLGHVRKEEGVEYFMMKHQEEKKESLVQALYGITSEYAAGKLDKAGYDQKTLEIEGQLKAVSAKASLLRSRLDAGKNTEEEVVQKKETITAQVTTKPVLIKQAEPEKKEETTPKKAQQEKTALGGYDHYKEDISVLKVIKYMIIFLAIGGIILHFYLNSHCISAPITVKAPDIIALLDIIKAESPGDYGMLCKYSTGGIEYIGGAKPMSHSNRILVSDASLGYNPQGDKIEKNEKLLAGNIIHEACHNMMYGVMGGYGKTIERDVERPCERMRYMFLYREGYYISYSEMVNALAGEEYGKKPIGTGSGITAVFRQTDAEKFYKYGFLNNYCERARIRTERTSEAPQGDRLTFENTGGVNIHCGTIELLVNDVEYPLDCFDLVPGEKYQTGKDFRLMSKDTYSARIVGCPS